MKLCSRLLMLLKKARKSISKKKQVSIIYQSEKGPQEQIGKQRWGSAAALLQDGEQRDQRPSQPHSDGRRFPEITCKCCAVFLEHLGVLQDREAASVRWEKVTVCTCTPPLAFTSVCKRKSAIASNVVTVGCVWIRARAGTAEEVSTRQSRRFIYSAILRMDGSFILLPSRTEAWLSPLQRLHLLPLHGPGEANTQWSQPWPHHPVTLFYSA